MSTFYLLSLMSFSTWKNVTKKDHMYLLYIHSLIIILQMKGCQPGKRRARFFGFRASCIRWLTCPDRLSWTPSSTPCSFWRNRSSTRSANLFTLSGVSPEINHCIKCYLTPNKSSLLFISFLRVKSGKVKILLIMND